MEDGGGDVAVGRGVGGAHGGARFPVGAVP